MVPGNSDGIPRVPPYSGTRTGPVLASVRGLHPLRPAVPDGSVGLPAYHAADPITPARASRHRRFGLFPVRSPLLGESFLLSSPAGTKMFQFPAFASRLARDVGIAPDGLPHSDILRSKGICPSLRLFAACHVLHRLREPRHPPCALLSLRMSFQALREHVPAAWHGSSTFASCICLHHSVHSPSTRVTADGARLLYSFVCLPRFDLRELSEPPFRESPPPEISLPACHCALSW